MALTDQEASIIALFVESACWGIFLVTFGLCLRALLWTNTGFKPFSQIDRPMVAICIAMPIFATVNLALNILRAVESVRASGISDQFTNLGSATETVKFICVNVQTLIADAMLTYRVWVIYSKSWAAAIVPAFLWLGVLVAAILNIIVLHSIHSEALTAAKSLRPIVTSFWSISIALNIIATMLIVIRIYRVDRSNAEFSIVSRSTARSRRYSRLQQIMRIIIESGALYTSVAITTCATYVSGSQGVYVTSAIEMQTVGIAFNLIIIRVSQAGRNAYTTKTSTQSHSIPLHFTRRPPKDSEAIEVSVDHQVEDDSDPPKLESTVTSSQSHSIGAISGFEVE
ncbi:uncharacterized protein BT62DRAFT_904813 [Guyanagaster necrorhizus]|uniref:Uncharacterized protein n=1 Tax=Guyanagaster necrorhizus TaxID=856835 RepID=A0A9P8AQJ7_9AGAR|nr:uncharacterized protein BT62DRAFT_904813 [Guyanagaster necrorhizus MCA 3950]KAG7442942.1 hypothetical protein BT62DRAFT_904813 [Guyanagaster necrorhizus MCA 3950]